MVAALRSDFGPLPDQSMHEKTAVSDLIEELYTFLRQADSRELDLLFTALDAAREAGDSAKAAEIQNQIDNYETHIVPIIADIDAGFGNPEATYLLAKRMRSNVRDLEGALNTLAARANFTGRPITSEFAQETLRDLLRAQQQAIGIANIQKVVADYYGLQIKDLLGKRRTRSLARPRQMAMALAKELTEHSLPEIGDAFAGRDHTTVLHACRTSRGLLDTDGKLREDWDKLIRKLTE